MTTHDLLLLALGPLAWGVVVGALVILWAVGVTVRDLVRLRVATRRLQRLLRGQRGTRYPSVAAWQAARHAQPGQPHHHDCHCDQCCDTAQAEALLARVGLIHEVQR